MLDDFESGRLAPTSFVKKVNGLLGLNLSFDEFLEAWNSLLDQPNIPLIQFLSQLKTNIILASNTGEIHWNYISSIFKTLNFTPPAFLSFQVGLKKPTPAYFLKLIETHRLDPKTSLFIDDSQKNVDQAKLVGLNSYQYLNTPDTITFLQSNFNQ